MLSFVILTEGAVRSGVCRVSILRVSFYGSAARGFTVSHFFFLLTACIFSKPTRNTADKYGDESMRPYAGIHKTIVRTLFLSLASVSVVLADDRGQIYSGETVTGLQITAPSYTDSWSLDGTAGQRILISVKRTAGATFFTPNVLLYPPDSNIAEAGPNSIIDHSLQQSGLYRIDVFDTGYNDEGTYNITLLALPDGALTCPNDVNGGPINSGQTLSGTVVASDMDAFQFTGQADDRVLITVKPTSTVTGFNPVAKLYPPDGNVTEVNASGTIEHQLFQSGLYTIVLNDDDYAQQGPYNITFVNLQNFAPADFQPDGIVDTNDLALLAGHWLNTDCGELNDWCDWTDLDGDNTIDFNDYCVLAQYWQCGMSVSSDGPIVSGQTISDNLLISDMDAFWFHGSQNDRVLIVAKKTSGPTYFNPFLKLFPPDGEPNEVGPSATIDHQLAYSGLYTLVAYDGGYSEAGTYNLSLLNLTTGPLTSQADANGGPIVSGQTVSGSIAVADLDAFQFSGQAGCRVLVIVKKISGDSGFIPYIRLYPPDGSAYQAGPADIIDYQLTQTGTHTIVIHDDNYSHQGNYNVTLLILPDGPLTCPGDGDGGSIACDQNQVGSSVVSDMDAFQFYGSQGQTVDVNAVKTSGGIYYKPVVSLYPPDGGPSEAGPLSFIDDHQLQQSGTYTILVSDDGFSDTGSYTIRLECP